MEAAVRIVPDVIRVVEFVGGDVFVRDPELTHKVLRVPFMRVRNRCHRNKPPSRDPIAAGRRTAFAAFRAAWQGSTGPRWWSFSNYSNVAREPLCGPPTLL